jgi:hypothetical protein
VAKPCTPEPAGGAASLPFGGYRSEPKAGANCQL